MSIYNLQLISSEGELIQCNIFLYVLGYSRIKYLEIIFDRTQTTLFRCLDNDFDYTGGVSLSKVVFNERFR